MPVTSKEDALYTLFYEYYRYYTIYSIQEGRYCIDCTQGCVKLRGKFVCFPDIEEAKTLIKRFWAEGYTSDNPVWKITIEVSQQDTRVLEFMQAKCRGMRNGEFQRREEDPTREQAV